ncbi:MAG: CDP-diacylglycerol--serine O-phosphatidyltransferase [Myxococcales bacterium]
MRVNLRKSLFLLPNLITLSSVFCGFSAILLCGTGASENDFYRAALLIVYAMFFDTIDGRVARLTKTQSALGVQLDSLADVISFGVAPGCLLYRWSLESLGPVGLAACFAFVSAGVIRLARFNVLATNDSGAPKKPGKYILGLPIPGAAGIVVSLVVANHSISGHLPQLKMLVLAVVLVLSACMVSTIRFRSFKDLHLSLRTVLFVLFAVGSTTFIALRFKPAFALVWLLTSYVVIGLAEAFLSLTARTLRRGRHSPRTGHPGVQPEAQPQPVEHRRPR